MSKNQDLSLVELALFATKLQKRITSMNVNRAADPAEVQRVHDECRNEAIMEAGRLAVPGTYVEAPKPQAGVLEPIANRLAREHAERVQVTPAELDRIGKETTQALDRAIRATAPHLRAIEGGRKPKRRRLSAAHLAKLKKARDAYFRKKGFGKYAKAAKGRRRKAS